MPRFRLLGTAAGGGFPQWNCSCPLCSGCRQNPIAIPPRLHLQAVFSGEGPGRFLINASPDLKFQIEAEPALWPCGANGRRSTPIAGIVLTSADLDQVLGLLLLREFQPLVVFATSAVRRVLEANSFFRMLHRIPNQLTWVEIFPGRSFLLGGEIQCTPIPLSDCLPFYAADSSKGNLRNLEFSTVPPGQASIGLVLEWKDRRIAYTPALPEITSELRAIYNTCDAILVDGTFWSDAELSNTQDGTPLARSIGHIPMSGPDGTIALLASVTRPRKIFVHINNTNPVLDPRSEERKLIEDAGWQLGDDGWQWN